jgi:hypothetical protein
VGRGVTAGSLARSGKVISMVEREMIRYRIAVLPLETLFEMAKRLILQPATLLDNVAASAF